MSDDAAPDLAASDLAKEDEGTNWIEVAAAILLGVAGVLTAYAAYNGALAGGDALKGYTQSSRTTAEAEGFYADYTATVNADQALFLDYQILVQQGDTDTAEVIKDNLFSEALTVATDAWLEIPEGEGPATPLDADEYVIESFDVYQELSAQAEAEFAEAADIDDQGDNFDLATVYLAVSLFFAGIAALFKVQGVRIVLLGVSAALLVPGLIAIANGKGWL